MKTKDAMKKLLSSIIAGAAVWLSWTNTDPVRVYYRTNLTKGVWHQVGQRTYVGTNSVGVKFAPGVPVMFFNVVTTNGVSVKSSITTR